ncbi:MAG: prenyltransferase/squalene oxidase repeat-containing protein [Verrucomicrobiales bacterium]|nr:prenyltransferase/squalene oxidase repeat-containing protein [Verrucomicrobiales bacterium]
MMNRILAFALISSLPLMGMSQDRIQQSKDGDVSLKLEISRAIDKGISFLNSKQNPEDGSWSDSKIPAFTALAISSIVGNPERDPSAPLTAGVEKGYEFLLKNQKADGGIYGKGLATYNTALSVMALSQSGKPEHLPVIAKARRLLINQQQDYDRKGQVDNLFDGGIGYGGSYAHSDLSNTHFAMEALYYSKKVLADTEYDESGEFELDWDAAVEFVSLCQNSEKSAERMGDMVGVREEDKGGFIYFPGNTKSDVIQLEEDGKKVALRSYGSISYAGLLAFIYAELDSSDPRLQSALTWLQANYTLEENPGMDAQGLFYYYHTMAKALSIAQINYLKTPEGKNINWRKDLALKIMSKQGTDGGWINDESNRWMEDDKVLVSTYALLALEHIFRGL